MTGPEATEGLMLEQNWAYKVTVLADRIGRHVAVRVEAASGLNLSQWRVLAAVADRPGRTASEVVAMTPMDKGIVSRAVGFLVERGLLERRASSRDARRSHLFLTDAGQRIHAGIVGELNRSGASGLSTATPEAREALIGLLDAFIAAYPPGPVREMGTPGPAGLQPPAEAGE